MDLVARTVLRIVVTGHQLPHCATLSQQLPTVRFMSLSRSTQSMSAELDSLTKAFSLHFTSNSILQEPFPQVLELTKKQL